MKEFFKNNYKKIIKIAIILVVLIGISIGAYFICQSLGVTDINTLRDFIKGCGSWGVIVYMLIRILMTMFMSFIPAISMLFDLLSVALFGANWQAFLVSFSSVIICSTIMYVLGRFGANKFLGKIIGKEDLNKAEKLINDNGVIAYGLMMCLGGFPDDALVCMAGATKMKIAIFAPITAIGRGIGCAFTIFGVSLIPFEKFTTFYDWFVFVACALFFIIVIFKVGNYISKKFIKK